MHAKTIVTALDAIAALKRAPSLGERQRTDGISAVRTVVGQLERCSVVNDALLASVDFSNLVTLDARLRALSAMATGLTPRSLAQTVSRFRAALRAVGIPIPDGRGHRPLSVAWTAFLDAITAADRTILLPLALWMNDHYVEPRS